MRVDGIDEVAFNCIELFGLKLSFQKIDLGRGQRRSLFSGEDGNALRGGIGTLVKLTGKKLDSEAVGRRRELGSRNLGKRLRKDVLARLGEVAVAEAIDEVTLQDPEVL